MPSASIEHRILLAEMFGVWATGFLELPQEMFEVVRGRVQASTFNFTFSSYKFINSIYKLSQGSPVGA